MKQTKTDLRRAPMAAAKVLRPRAAAAYMGEGETTFWLRAKNDPDHPKPFKISPRIAVVYVADCDRFLQTMQMRTAAAAAREAA